ncbi:mitochondrial carrier domain-containing protein [Yarrowia lipolytica]|jgi:adenine nucleotide transporter 17|nr:mitochondrial carrier domain-containing protein [Yarrowia lipolytica]QNP97425.1 Peroxisomal adenine nucleotide transporter 1 [Yarrowia lipolytica]RDW30629.1 mitochondrial carrier domain-containing protein [Yarrowia lipolytica]RDW37457.1 mitochondrial carrier domain-containing protein [Yarrowia lipolytica]RDW44864.1 mitochondrial carrier domain-containing protein [Yarrowia lipolytica]
MSKPDSAAERAANFEPSDMSAGASALSGAIGGAVANLAVFPLDLVTTRLQVQKGYLDEDDQYKSLLDAFTKIVKNEGIFALYDGAFQDTISTMVSAFFYFFAYDFLRNNRLKMKRLPNGRLPKTLGIAEELLVGSLAGIFCRFITSPLGNIVTRQQTAALVQKSNRATPEAAAHASEKKYGHVITGVNPEVPPVTPTTVETPSAVQIAKDIYKEKGITGFWTGYKATVVLSINPSLTYYFFQALKANLIPYKRRDNPTGGELFLYSALAKSLAGLITYPYILAKTRLQVKSDSGSNKAKSASQMVVDTIKKEGVLGLWEGCQGQILKGFFSQGITMLIKDKIARLLIYIYFLLVR